jgi:PIN domain nuclease of toxin-antitoxin system
VSRSNPILLDTCALIWFVEGRLAGSVLEALHRAAEADGVFVSPVSAWEIGLVSTRRRGRSAMEFLPDPQTWLADVIARPELREAPLTSSTALAASYLPEPLHGDPADRLLIATAREMNAALATGDVDILAYAEAGHVKVLPC